MNKLIGNTPIYKTHKLNVGCCELFLKLEHMNFGASIKDRIATAMIDRAEKLGYLKPGYTIVEGSAGNTGLALCQVAAARGYKVIIVVPDKVSNEKIMQLKAMRAEVIVTDNNVAQDSPKHFQNLAATIAASKTEYYHIDQFNNPANPQIHEETTAPEIWQQMDHDLDTIVLGAGTGGHLTGIGRYFAKIEKPVEIILADPCGSLLAPTFNCEQQQDIAWQVEGVGSSEVPKVCDLSYLTAAVSVTDNESFAACRVLLEQESILAGPSTGTLLAAALSYCKKQTTPKRVLSFVYDSGSKYISKIFNDEWLQKHNYDLSNQLEELL